MSGFFDVETTVYCGAEKVFKFKKLFYKWPFNLTKEFQYE